jgi:aldehyde:ferredoxin oxidoreductase
VGGFHGRYLRVDLESGRQRALPLPESVLRRHLGGIGLGAWLLYREAPPGVEPLSPGAPLIFAFSPLAGTALTTSAKFAIVGRSPLTGYISDGLSSSHFAIAGKALGFDALVFIGRAARPSIWHSGRLLATDLWGASTTETRRALESRGRVACIGPAGENGVRFASISNDGRHAGRGGLGAVMGSKLLKAIVLDGESTTPVADPEEVARLARDLAQRSRGDATAKYRELGTTANLNTFNRLAILPTRNFQRSRFEGAERLGGEAGSSLLRTERRACASCTIGCEHRYRSSEKNPRQNDIPGAATTGSGIRIEYESLFALGPLCGIDDPERVLAAAQRCDELGLDTISCGATIAFAMECGERGWLAEGPDFGDAEALLGLIEEIAERRGLGDLLAEGSRRAAQRIGHDAPRIAPHVKGLELPGYEPRAMQAMALGLAVSTRGADHNKSGAYEADFSEFVDRRRGNATSVRLAIESEDRAALLDSLILCKFLRGAFDDLYRDTAALLAAVTGWQIGGDELREIARRNIALRKAYNIREGWKSEEDALPPRFHEAPLELGPSRGARLPRERLNEMIRLYNRFRGWTDAGYLPGDLLRELELGEEYGDPT